MPWTSDLEFGERMEKEYLKFTDYKSCKKMNGNFKYYDLEIIDRDDNKIYIEIKADRQTRNTNNIFIEFECNGQPSGINTSTANLWVYFENYPTYTSQHLYNELTKDKKLNYYQKKSLENQHLVFNNDYTIYQIEKSLIMEMINDKKYNRIYEGFIEGKKMKGYLFNKDLFKNQIIHKYNNLDLNKLFEIII
jgi:hypothetical protein